MVNVPTNISLDYALKEYAKDNSINISALTERALINKMRSPDIEEIKELKCAFCHEIGIKETEETEEDVKEQNRKATLNEDADHPLTYSEPFKLTWLWPDEKWVCNKCLKIKCRSISVSS